MQISIRDSRGQAAAEMAIVLPVLMFLLLAIIQFGVLFKDYLALTDAVREGARKGAVSRHLGAGAEGATEDAVRDSAQDLKSGLEVDAQSSWQPGADLVVTASYPYSVKLLGFVLKDGRLESATTERVE